MKFRVAALVLGFCLDAGGAVAVPPTIHVDWGDPIPPVLDLHYRVSTIPPASVDFPDVELLVDRLDWQIWSTDPDDPDNLGNIGVISCPHDANFGVKIQDDLGGAGARDVKGIILDPLGDHLSSIGAGSKITGDLNGDLFVQEHSIGIGGDVDFTIVGSAVGNMTIPTVSSLSIFTTVFGTLQVDEVLRLAPPLSADLTIGVVAGNVQVGVLKGALSVSQLVGSGVVTVTQRIEGGIVRASTLSPTASIVIADMVSDGATASMVELEVFKGTLVLRHAFATRRLLRTMAPVVMKNSAMMTTPHCETVGIGSGSIVPKRT